ncbi:MAG: GNAT family N-acetyltransferase [Planctomycetia bacterium]|nr:GNAT family N-acetyltransferase [Planctomycetia bacterium]
MNEGPLRATLDDFDTIIELVDVCFPGDRLTGGMLARWPHCYIRRPEKLRNSIIMKDGRRVISFVGVIDQSLVVGGDELRIAGISGVATHPKYRGKGFMAKVLSAVRRVMRKDGYAVSDLGGDVQRYGAFGWELAGRCWNFQITPRSFLWEDSGAQSAGTAAAQLQVSLAKDIAARQCDGLDQIIELHQQSQTPILKRSWELSQTVFGRIGKKVWTARNPRGELVAYLAATPGDDSTYSIDEFGGQSAGVEAILAHLIRDLKAEALTVRSPIRDAMNETFFRLSTAWQVACMRLVKLVDITRTLKGFASQLAERCRDRKLSGRHVVHFDVTRTAQQCTMEFSAHGAKVLLQDEPPADAPVIALTEREMTRLLFGPGSPSTVALLPKEAKFLDALLPLDFYISGLESV